MQLCQLPQVACETTLGPIRDFDFDAAILFSDLLFPLDALGMGLSYTDSGPKLSWHLRQLSDLKRFKTGPGLSQNLEFQSLALKAIRQALPSSKGLLGFVGGPLTLFCYAVEGSHQGELRSAKEGLKDGRFEGFCEVLFELLVDNLVSQARANADVVAVLDTCAGELDESELKQFVVPALRRVCEAFQARCPEGKLLYYSKSTGPSYWSQLVDLPILGLGIDWKHNLAQVLRDWHGRFAIQGNIDPSWLFLEPLELESRVRSVFNEVRALPESMRQGWICGLGHGVLPKTPEDHVRRVLRIQKEIFGGPTS